MRLNRQSEIAISILAACAAAPEQQLQTVQLAEIAQTTKDHAAQIISILTRSGYLRTSRGRSGGVRLAADARELTLNQVLRITQPDLAKRAGRTLDTPATLVGPIVDAAFAPFLRVMERVTIADLISPSDGAKAPCFECCLVKQHSPHGGLRTLQSVPGD
ncbi:RrF2 family transcriptional regulator [Neorhizobium sp. DT-125]|uniref:RrF2 family transcriptional regulator n=1 Tax=Neorhizobium sp. DT-125 TaxID=3396163 RepID=UPI003F1D3CD2